MTTVESVFGLMTANAFETRITPLVNTAGTLLKPLPVRMSMQLIKLFSEGLYQSPHKAVEELVANGYDAGAARTWVFTRRDGFPEDALWVIDDGSGMDAEGFEILWQIAKSPKLESPTTPLADRVAIGQFGIGKLAAMFSRRPSHAHKQT